MKGPAQHRTQTALGFVTHTHTSTHTHGCTQCSLQWHLQGSTLHPYFRKLVYKYINNTIINLPHLRSTPGHVLAGREKGEDGTGKKKWEKHQVISQDLRLMLYFFSFQNMPVRLWACLRLYLAAIHSAAPEVCFFSVITNPPPFLIMLTQHSPGYPISARK